MACATLKRSLDWEPVLGGRPAKRRRCIPFCESPTTTVRDRASTSSVASPSASSSTASGNKATKSVFPDVVSQKLTPVAGYRSFLTEVATLMIYDQPPIKYQFSVAVYINPDYRSFRITLQWRAELTEPYLHCFTFNVIEDAEYMAENIKAELKRLHRRRQLQYSNMENSDGGTSSGGENNVDLPSRSERALFTFKQVGLICERMLRELESEIREEYNSVLNGKLAEQYDAFVKFTYDQIHKNYSTAPPSYLS